MIKEHIIKACEIVNTAYWTSLISANAKDALHINHYLVWSNPDDETFETQGNIVISTLKKKGCSSSTLWKSDVWLPGTQGMRDITGRYFVPPNGHFNHRCCLLLNKNTSTNTFTWRIVLNINWRGTRYYDKEHESTLILCEDNNPFATDVISINSMYID